jgi:hypothetical protein
MAGRVGHYRMDAAMAVPNAGSQPLRMAGSGITCDVLGTDHHL